MARGGGGRYSRTFHPFSVIVRESGRSSIHGRYPEAPAPGPLGPPLFAGDDGRVRDDAVLHFTIALASFQTLPSTSLSKLTGSLSGLIEPIFFISAAVASSL